MPSRLSERSLLWSLQRGAETIEAPGSASNMVHLSDIILHVSLYVQQRNWTVCSNGIRVRGELPGQISHCVGLVVS